VIGVEYFPPRGRAGVYLDYRHLDYRPPLIGPEATVEQWMTRSPERIAMHQSLASAQKRMVDLGVRHLPMLDGGQLVGVISDRDLGLLGSGVAVGSLEMRRP
jgi:predicted transcriptional regulator